MRDGVNPPVKPPHRPVVELIDRRRRVQVLLNQEALAQLTEGPLDLAFAFGVAGGARLHHETVVAGQLQRRRVQREPAALRRAQRPHPVRACDAGHTADRLDESHDARESVVAVD